LVKKNPSLTSNFTNKVVRSRTMLLICLILSFLFYANSIENGYSLDDELVMSTDRHAHEVVELGIGGIKEIFTTNYAVDGKQNYEYRPIVTLSYALEWTLFSDHPNKVHISHFINVLLYALCGYLLFLLLQSFFKNEKTYFSALVVGVFMIHPIHSEVVNNLKNRDEMLSFIFAMWAAIQVFRWVDQQHWKHLIFGLILLTLSVLSKKSNLPFMAIIPVMLYYFRDISWKKIGISLSVLVFAQILYRVMKLSLVSADLNRTFSFLENPLYEMSFLERIPVYFQTNLFYIQKLLFPYPLHFYYGYNALPVATFSSISFILGLLVMILLLFLVIKGLKTKTWYSFSILFFLMAIGGAGNLLTPMVGIVAERFIFTGSIGFSIAVVGVIFLVTKSEVQDTKDWMKKPMYVLTVLALPCLVYSIQRNNDWFSKKSLYLADVKTTSESAKVNSLIATEMQEEAFRIQKEDLGAYNLMMSKVDSAIQFYTKSVSIFNRYESNWNNKGTLLYTFYFDFPRAIQSFKQATDVNDKYYEGFLNIGNSYAKMAEGYDNLLTHLPATKMTQNVSPEIDQLFRSQLLFRSFSITRKFQANAIAQIKAGFTFERSQLLFNYASLLEKMDPLLVKIQFSENIKGAMNFALQTKMPPKIEILESMRRELTENFTKELKIKPDELAAQAKYLKKVYLDSAKVYFQKTYDIKPKLESLYYSIDQFSMLLKDYQLLIDIQEKYLKNFKKKYNAPTYIQMANGYFNLGRMDKASEFFKKGMNDLQLELSELNALPNITSEQSQRKLGIENEIARLSQFVQKIKSGEIPVPVAE
jgi:protein O-mannosyl-transferase